MPTRGRDQRPPVNSHMAQIGMQCESNPGMAMFNGVITSAWRPVLSEQLLVHWCWGRQPGTATKGLLFCLRVRWLNCNHWRVRQPNNEVRYLWICTFVAREKWRAKSGQCVHRVLAPMEDVLETGRPPLGLDQTEIVAHPLSWKPGP